MIERTDVDGIAVVRLARAPVNALDADMCLELIDAFGELASDAVRAVVLTGAGRAFCAGLDLKALLAGGDDYVRRIVPLLDGAFEAVFRLGKPVVAAVNGHAIAGGCVLAAACDHRVMTDGADATIGVPELHVGMPFPTGALEICRHAFGTALLRRLALDGSMLSPDAALAAGVVDELATDAALLDRALERAARLGGGTIPADTFALHKAQTNRDTIERILRDRPHDTARLVDIWCRPSTHAWIAGRLGRA